MILYINKVSYIKWKERKRNKNYYWTFSVDVHGQKLEAAVRRCFSEQMFLKILKYLQEGTCFGVSF